MHASISSRSLSLIASRVALHRRRRGAQRAATDPRVILISIDGLMPSSYTEPAIAAQTPNLRRLAKQGVWADGVVGVLPTVTYPSHTTLITGVEPAVHGIYDNRIFDPENKSRTARGSGMRDAIKVPTLPMAARARGPARRGRHLAGDDRHGPRLPGAGVHRLEARGEPVDAAGAVAAARR